MEALILDPPEFIEGRTPLPLDELGLEVREAGADFGESQVEVQLARQAIGESVTNRHLTNVTMKIPIRVQAEGGVSLAEAAYKLQQKVALWQAEGGWLRRDFSAEGAFAGSVGYRILTANLSGLQGWLMAHRATAPEVTLTLIRTPLGYAATEQEDSVASAENELIYTLEDLKGSSPGLIRRRVKNENASAHWRGLIAAMECRDYPASGAETTAKLSYEAKALTRKGGSTEAERESKKVVRNTELSAGWLSVLDTQISGVGHMTHVGVRRPYAKVYVEGGEVGNVQVKLIWRPLGALSWSENESVTVPVVNGWAIVDLGEVRPESAVLGEQRWEGQIQARATTGSGKIDIRRLWPLPTEQFHVLNSPAGLAFPERQSAKSPGTVVDDETAGGLVAWKEASQAKTSDNFYATVVIGGPGKETSHYLKATNFGFTLPVNATVTGITVAVKRSTSKTSDVISDRSVELVRAGSILKPTEHASSDPWPPVNEFKVYGSSRDLWNEEWSATEDINSSGFGVALQVAGAGTARVDSIKITVYYTEAEDEHIVCFAERSLELRSDGIYRQHKTDEIWAPLVPTEGSFYPAAPVSGLEGRKARAIVIPTQGDLEAIADSGTNKLSEKVYRRPAYLFAREAA